MTPRYWAGIIVGMLAVFCVGMVVAKGVHKGKEFVTSNYPAYLGLINADFRVNGHRAGDIRRLQFMRSSPGQVDSAVLTVEPNGDADAMQAPECRLRVTNAQPFNSNTRFSCSSDADSVRLDLVPFGHVNLLPDGKKIPLYVAADRIDDVRLHAYRGTGGSDSGDVDIKTADGMISITVNGQELVHASGDSAGGSLVIRDGNGHVLVQLSGDSSGGSIKVTDADGKTRLNLHGSKKDSSH